MDFPPADLPNMAGVAIGSGKIKLVEEIGTGGFGAVYRALDIKSGSVLAVKCVRKRREKPGREPREISLQRLVCNHPNIVSVRGFYDDEEFVYAALDYCPGGDLFTAVVERGVFNAQDDLIKTAYLQILDAVDWCHSRRIAHRDIKPENVLCSEDYSMMYLADFGLASQDAFSKDFGRGSPFYLSPECLDEHRKLVPYSPFKADVWALGVVLVNMITRHNPWHLASIKDPLYHEYLRSPSSLALMLKISPATLTILKRVFIPHGLRITIPELRKRIEAVDSFYPESKEKAEATPKVHKMTASRGSSHRSIRVAVVTPITTRSNSSPVEVSTDSSQSSGEGYLFSTPPTPFPGRLPRKTFANPRQKTPAFTTDVSTTDEESSVPITPLSRPVDPSVDVLPMDPLDSPSAVKRCIAGMRGLVVNDKRRNARRLDL
ncbi:kinase-like domain-containing protein [Thelephora terrestris]|uniref:Kinase-like domain-containing protein n=1 Tax=Thelephora terrestris TaxID=56493 RepID=A0A9P6HA63_9AGAM|nr:kinase-like domain-containing protein [Thelephora terrestris]